MQQILGDELLVQIDQAAVVVVDTLERTGQVIFIIQTVSGQVSAQRKQVNVDVDAAFLQLADQKIKPVKIVRMQFAGMPFAVIDKGVGMFSDLIGVHMMHAHHVDARCRQAIRHLYRNFLVRHGSAKHQVDTEETDRLAVLKHKFAVFRPDKSVFPRRRIKQMAKIKAPVPTSLFVMT